MLILQNKGFHEFVLYIHIHIYIYIYIYIYVYIYKKNAINKKDFENILNDIHDNKIIMTIKILVNV